MNHVADKEKHVTIRGINVDDIGLMNNKVLCKKLFTNIKEKTKGGIYYPESMHENQRLHQNADGIFEVVAVPERLTPKVGLWETDIEVKVGDIVWVDRLESLNATAVYGDDSTEYRLIGYHSIIVAKRLVHYMDYANTVPKYLVEDTRVYEVIPVNGMILCSDIYHESNLAVSRKKLDLVRAKVEYVGKPNKYYYHGKKKAYLDTEEEIKPRQIIALNVANKNENIVSRSYLEDKKFARFNGDKEYFYIQRRHINAILYE